jgi:hypothetical protein
MVWFCGMKGGGIMKLKVACSLDEVIEGWRLVYHQYVAAALIEMNPFSIFTFPEYISRNAAIMLGRENDQNVCSVSAVLDSDTGLPLDAYFGDEIGSLRKRKKKLIEIGLLASIKKFTHYNHMVELLSSVAGFGVFSDYHDYVIGVHPRRKAFFKEVYDFSQIGEAKIYHKLRRAEVALLYADARHFETAAKRAWRDIYSGIRELHFDERFVFEKPDDLIGHESSDYFISFLRKMKRKFLPPESLHGKMCMLKPGMY